MVGPIYAKRLEKLGIITIEDLLYHFPFRYDDFSIISKIERVRVGEIVTIQAKIMSVTNEYTRSGKKIQKATVSDDSGSLELTWFNQPFLTRILREGEIYNFSGKVDWFGRKITMISPEYEQIKNMLVNKTIHTGRLVPVYPETYGISSKWLRSRIAPLLPIITPQVLDFLPPEIKNTYSLPPLDLALNQIHFPPNNKEYLSAKRRLAFDELFLIQLATLKRKKDWQKKAITRKFETNQEKVDQFINNLPFMLTTAQRRCIQEILADLSKPQSMNRLLEGDVGSGKTIVAAVAIYVAYLNGYQSALMAPTEILATQHHQILTELLGPLGIKVVLLTGSKKTIKKTDQAKPDLFVGTHALIANNLEFDNLSLVIIDEQHRFGVEQRAKLISKGNSPHLLTMTATPIPRTIALTLFGDLDLSVIDEMPKGRIKIKTWVVPPTKREAAYRWIRSRVKETDEQAFIICPLIDESETAQTAKAAQGEFERLKRDIFPDLRLGLLHGRMKSKEKDEVLDRFRAGKIDILVSTPVVEVGIDIPQATIMVIETADRFGLAQLHQLRGRVGRGNKESFCLLFTDINEVRVIQRLKAMETINIGMELADLDLKMRGPGEVYGTAQHGISNLRMASFTDLDLINQTRGAASQLVENLEKYPKLLKNLERHQSKLIEAN